jgi:hypothetical protein
MTAIYSLLSARTDYATLCMVARKMPVVLDVDVHCFQRQKHKWRKKISHSKKMFPLYRKAFCRRMGIGFISAYRLKVNE